MIEILSPSLPPTLLGLVSYVGIFLYAGVLTVPGRSRYSASWQLLLFYLASFPLPGPSSAWLGQQVLLLVAGASLGPQILGLQLRFRGELLGRERTAGAARRVTAALALAGLASAAAGGLVAFALWRRWVDPGLAGGESTALLLRAWMILGAVLALDLAAAFLLGRRWAHAAQRIPLLAPAVRFHRLNGVGALAVGAMVASLAVTAPGSPAASFLALCILVVALIPGLVDAAASYDALLSGVLTFHVVAVAIAAIVVGARLLEAVGLAGPLQDVFVSAFAAIVAMLLPSRVSREVEARLFPRAARLRTRLVELAGLPVAGDSRADAARDLLARVVDPVDAEGALIALPRSGAEPATLVAVGGVDARTLGDPQEAVAYLAALAPRLRPVAAERLRMPDQLRLLRCGAVVLVPFRTGGAVGALLLGPRRGRLYDAATLDALESFAARTAVALENALLLAARAHAEKLAALGEAAARIAHEIRNPLTSARSLVQLVARDPQSGELAQTALGELDRIARLVGDLVAFARRQEVMHLDRVDLAQVVRLAVAQLYSLAEEREVAVACDVDPAIVLGDRDRLVQVVANLVRNAIEAFGEGGRPDPTGHPADHRERRVSLRIACDGASARLEVADTGPGIPPEDLDTVFEPFRTTKRSGSGLGLAIARRIVEAHRGRIEVESRVGRGTVFAIELPLEEPASAPALSRRPPPA